jgi:acid phosphatase (class A)
MMMIRYAVLAFLIAVLGAAPASAQKLNYLTQIIDLPELLPPPPGPDSQALKDDIAGVMEAQENRTDIQMQRALVQKTLSIYHFAEVLGPKFKKENLPIMDAFFERAHIDQRATLIAAKNKIQRMRPFMVDKRIQPLAGTPRLPTGYPSGGTVMTQMTAILLSKMIPEKRLELHESSREYNLTRIIIGEHFPRDVRAGEIAGTVITHALLEVPAFMRDFEPARVELRKVLGYPPEPDAVGSTQPK